MNVTLTQAGSTHGPGAALQEAERWYVVRTQPRRESQAFHHLNNQKFQVFLPRFFKSRRHARKFESVLAPLFPCYMFAALDLARDRWRSINGTYGVDRLLMRSGIPTPVPHGLVERLAAAVNADGSVGFGSRLAIGQTVCVTAGPFTDLLGELERLDDQGRVRVLLEIMGGKISVSLPEQFVAVC